MPSPEEKPCGVHEASPLSNDGFTVHVRARRTASKETDPAVLEYASATFTFEKFFGAETICSA